MRRPPIVIRVIFAAVSGVEMMQAVAARAVRSLSRSYGAATSFARAERAWGEGQTHDWTELKDLYPLTRM